MMRLRALKARQIIARGEASVASATPGHMAKLMRALKGRKRFIPPFQGLDQFDTFPGVALATLASPLAIVCRAFSAPKLARAKSNWIRIVCRAFSASKLARAKSNWIRIVCRAFSAPKLARAKSNWIRIIALCLLPFAFLLSACRQDMHDQPKYTTFRPSTFFEDGKSERSLVDGTVPRRNLRDDASLSDGDSNGGRTLRIDLASEQGQTPPPDLAKVLTPPVRVTEELLNRGQERFNISCSPCHGRGGDGNGMIAQRGFRHPPSYHIDRLREAPIGHFYDVMTNGFGAMPSYADQVAPRDRWAIAVYIRALQLSRNATLADVPPEERGRLKPGGQAR
jgi:mono/diheme cytochrome c family protein